MLQSSVDSDVVWENKWGSVRYTPATLPDGTPYPHTTFRSGSGFGAVVVPRCIHRGVPYFGLIDIFRPATQSQGFEFPRGGTSDLSGAEAVRELTEETGLDDASLHRLGTLYPDNGIMDTRVGIWLASVEPQLSSDGSWAPARAGHVDEETGSTFGWVSQAELISAISRGDISDGMTIAAWGLLQSSRAAVPPTGQR